ncbi:molybdopterin synthase sulfur carrier subunit [Lentibacillus kapialis]|uniref:Molybdopterin synthase sulfur carrier subunit n=1 Tax=Lentibacillus kapialis TaxID=340214 RepID=A0A917PWL6_9BACI|nr:molybdopterin converting factor subunit 1 [Lentibacillus kapialis]GGJ95475.1 molybdopterin synthase sulfur carrier subunit [Lentibacillus kapialis]
MVDVLFFAELQEAAGSGKINVEAGGLSINELKAKLKSSYDLVDLDSAMTAVNEDYSHDDVKLTDGDTVAFIPPVSGG